MKHPNFRFTREYIITALDEQDAIKRFQELLDEEVQECKGVLDADCWWVEEIVDGEVIE